MKKFESIGDILRATDIELTIALSSDEVMGGDDFRKIALAQLLNRVRDEAHLKGVESISDILKTMTEKFKELAERTV